jgi:hypothetical protein
MQLKDYDKYAKIGLNESSPDKKEKQAEVEIRYRENSELS